MKSTSAPIAASCLLHRNQSKGCSTCSGFCTTICKHDHLTNAVNVVLKCAWKIHVDHMAHILNVKSSARDICGDQHPHSASTEVLQRSLPLVLQQQSQQQATAQQTTLSLCYQTSLLGLKEGNTLAVLLVKWSCTLQQPASCHSCK
jgi:hypothetical protein